MTDALLPPEQLRAIELGAHEHSDVCRGSYQVCGEHHLHDAHCGVHPLLCGRTETRAVNALLRHVRASDTFLEKACEGFDEVSSGYLRERDEARAELERVREALQEVLASYFAADDTEEEMDQKRWHEALHRAKAALTPPAAQPQEEP